MNFVAADLGPFGSIVVLLGLAIFGIYLAWSGRRFVQKSRYIADPATASATIEKLFTEGSWLTRSCYAAVSFQDSSGTAQQATIGLMDKVYQLSREGRKIYITYSIGNPKLAISGRSPAIFAAAGWIFQIVGIGLALLSAYVLAACSFRWDGWRW